MTMAQGTNMDDAFKGKHKCKTAVFDEAFQLFSYFFMERKATTGAGLHPRLHCKANRGENERACAYVCVCVCVPLFASLKD